MARLLAVLVGLACTASAFAQRDDPERYLGRKYWYDPEHDKNVPTEFYRMPRFDRGTYAIPRKMRFVVAEQSRGWLKVRFESATATGYVAYIPIRMLRLRLYAPRVAEPIQETFRKASIFEEDPEVIRRRLEQAAAAAKGPPPPPPWVIKRRPITPLKEPAPAAPTEPEPEAK